MFRPGPSLLAFSGLLGWPTKGQKGQTSVGQKNYYLCFLDVHLRIVYGACHEIGMNSA